MKEEVADIDKALIEAQKSGNGGTQNGYQFKGSEPESDDDDNTGVIRRFDDLQCQAITSTSSRGYTNGLNRSHDPPAQSTVSSNDSVDGYDSFENTNNKKKRKIPTSGSLGNHQSSLSAEMANMGISPSQDNDGTLHTPDGGVSQYYSTLNPATSPNTSGTGISGAGRGRYGRTGRRDASGRSPLGVSANSSNAWQQGRLGMARRDYSHSGSATGKRESFSNFEPLLCTHAKLWLARDLPSDHGIISAAMAEAAALPSNSPSGQENKSLLERSAAKKASPAKTQFTFTCESDSAKSMNWPADYYPLPGPTNHSAAAAAAGASTSQSMHNQKGFSTQGTQTSPTMAGQGNQNGAPAGNNAQPNTQPARKPRRPPGKRYAMSARERRLQQEYNNYHHPPREEDVWICEFCEYESIFGSPPEALVRQYEIKDRRERKRLAEKRRLLEKAKMKGRKGKKGSKNAAKNNTAATTQNDQPANQQTYQQPADPGLIQNHGTQSDEYFGDEYDDDPAPMPAPPPQAPTKIPQPVAQHYGQSVRSAHSNGIGTTRDREASRVA